MAAPLLPLLVLGAIAILATRKDDEPAAVAPPPTPPAPPPPAPPVGMPPGTTFPTPGFVPPFPSQFEPPPPPGDVALGVVPGIALPGSTACRYTAAVETLDVAFQEFEIGTLPAELMAFQGAYEAGLFTWFNSADLSPGFWMLLRGCGGAFSTVIATRMVLPGAVVAGL